MIEGQPSRTAWRAASLRAAHQVIEGGRLFADPLALRILGPDAERIVADLAGQPARRPMRIFIAARHRIAEDALAQAVATGLDQLVILGAGLDTFAYRSPHGPALRVIEVDHPSTQQWKRARLAEAAIATPAHVRYAPIDFERETLAECLAAAGFDASRRSFFMWLGVVPYLTEPAIFATLEMIAALPGGAEVVFDYGDPPETLSPEVRAIHDLSATRVAALGEAWLTYFEAPSLRERLIQCGFTGVEDFGIADIVARFFPGAAMPQRRGGHVIRAWKEAVLF